MQQVAALAEAAQVAQPVICGIVIQMRRGENNPRRALPCQLFEVRPATGAATAVAPGLLLRVEPSAVRQATDGRAVGTAAALTNSAGALEADPPTEVTPMGGIEGSELASNWHRLVRIHSVNSVFTRGQSGFDGTFVVVRFPQQ